MKRIVPGGKANIIQKSALEQIIGSVKQLQRLFDLFDLVPSILSFTSPFCCNFMYCRTKTALLAKMTWLERF